MTTLLDAIDALTKPYRHTVHDIHGQPQLDKDEQAVTVERPARLTQLHDAIRPSGSSGTGSSAARERILIDSGALEQWSQYRDRINAEARKVDVRPDNDPAVTLRRWYVAVESRTLTDAFEQEWVRRLGSWALAIDRRLNPPYRREVTAPCPFCGERRALDKETGQYVTAVVSECWRGEGGIDTSWFIQCRFCGQVGYSLQEVREWAYNIEQAEEGAA